MLMNKQEQSMEIDGMEYCVGMEIRCNEASDYAGLHGRILELRDGDDKESDNETIDIVCELYVPDNAEDREKIESRFSELYSRTVTVDDIGLDYVIMAPSMLESPEPSSEKNGESDSKPAPHEESSDQKKKEHEAFEAKRKAEWEAKQADKKASDEKALEDIRAMSDGSATDASIKKLNCDVERITRRNMKICVADHIQALCTANPDFARKVMHPRKSIINCFRYITRFALEYIKKEREDNGDPATGLDMGGDVPDDLCYKWAEDYFNDPDAKEDKTKDDEEFVPKPYYGGCSGSSKKTNIKTKTAEKPKDDKKSVNDGQVSLI